MLIFFRFSQFQFYQLQKHQMNLICFFEEKKIIFDNTTKWIKRSDIFNRLIPKAFPIGRI
jgi:hypothetical protein